MNGGKVESGQMAGLWLCGVSSSNWPSTPALRAMTWQWHFFWLGCYSPVVLKKWSWTVLWRPTRPSRTNTQKRSPCHYRGLECKSRKSRDTWSNRQIWLCSTKWSRAKTNRVLPRERTGHSKHPLPTTQERTLHMDITRWSILKSDWLYLPGAINCIKCFHALST